MKKLIFVLIATVTMVGCSSPYRITHSDNDYEAQPSADKAATITRGKISVTAGSLADSFATYPGIGFLINNASTRPMKLTADAVKVEVNGKPVPYKTYKQIKRNSRLEKVVGGLNTFSASMRRSSGGTVDQYGVDRRHYPLYQTDHDVRRDHDMARRVRQAQQNFKKRGDRTWTTSRHMRWLMTRNFGLARNYYLQDEMLAPGQGMLRVVLVDEKLLDKAAKGNASGLSPVNVRLTVGNTNFEFKMTAMALKNGQSVFYQPGRQAN